MFREVFRRARLAVGGKVRRRGATYEPCDSDATRDEVLPAHGADAHGSIEALVHQVDDAVRQFDLDLHGRVLAHELCDGRRHVLGAERHGARQPQRAARNGRALRCESFRFLEVGQELDRALVEGASGFRQRNAARGAVQETHAKVRLEVGDEARYGRNRDPGTRSRTGEAPGLHHAGKCSNSLEPVQSIIACIAIVYPL